MTNKNVIMSPWTADLCSIIHLIFMDCARFSSNLLWDVTPLFHQVTRKFSNVCGGTYGSTWFFRVSVSVYVCLFGWLVVYFTIGDLKANTRGLKNTKL